MKSVRTILRSVVVVCAMLSLTSCISSGDTDEGGSDSSEFSKSNIALAEWIDDALQDSEIFTDKTNYQYYARSLGLDKDYFLSADKWEFFYDEDNINRNCDVTKEHIYLIRLNPYTLLDIYAANNNCSVAEICKQISATKEQLYYNWGYNVSFNEYDANHKKNEVSYSDKENKIFGVANGEDRVAVMSTHMIIVDVDENYDCTYKSSVSDSISIFRRDIMKAFTKLDYAYTAYSEEESNPTFIENGIGVRAVIPLTIPNAWNEATGADINITAMYNVSPYSYGCTDNDKIDINSIIETIKTEE